MKPKFPALKALVWLVPAAGVLALPGAAFAQDAAISGADTAWVMTATALVLLMTLPGLAMFYAGLVRSVNVLSVMTHCLAIACLMSLLWLAVGYSIAFSDGNGFFGGLGKSFLLSVGRGDAWGSIPESVFFMFQATFAVITPALIVGAYVERIRFGAVILFSALWLLLVYAPVTHWVWGGGWLAERGALDFAGGLVVHATAGTSALVAAVMLRHRPGFPKDLNPPHNPGMTMIGAALLWVGWFGFNGGSALAANGDAGMAILVTHTSASAAALTWALIEKIKFGRASMIGMATGVIAGLATVTPASGYIGPLGGLILGVASGAVCYVAVDIVKHRLRIDDLLDVFAVHGVGGILGTLLASLLISTAVGGIGYDAAGAGSLGAQATAQVIGVIAVCAWSAIASIVIVFVTRVVCGWRHSDEALREGLDLSDHGERAYPQ